MIDSTRDEFPWEVIPRTSLFHFVEGMERYIRAREGVGDWAFAGEHDQAGLDRVAEELLVAAVRLLEVRGMPDRDIVTLLLAGAQRLLCCPAPRVLDDLPADGAACAVAALAQAYAGFDRRDVLSSL